MKQFVIAKEDVDFWLDENGTWQNRHGPFEHKRIIDHFHRSIRHDESGYYLLQTHGERVREKVYFPYRDTALFVFDVIVKNEPQADEKLVLVLNTKETILLEPGSLFVSDDQLYLSHDGHRIRFTAKSLFKISDFLSLEAGSYRIVLNGRSTAIEAYPTRMDKNSSSGKQVRSDQL